MPTLAIAAHTATELNAELLEKLRVEFTKSRPLHSNDNALAESKNSAVVREHLGNVHTPQYLASCRQHKQTDHAAGEKLDLIYDALLEHYPPCLTPDYRHP